MKIAILCKYPFRLASTLQFLSKREMTAVTYNNLKEFVGAVEPGGYDFLVVSLNYPHPKTSRLIAILEQMFNKPVIAFVEDLGKSTSTVLQNSGIRFRIPGQISGPALEMAISRALREIEMEKQAAEVTISSGQAQKSTDAGGRIIVTARGNADSDNVVFVDKGQKMRAELMELLSHDSNEHQFAQNQSLAANGSYSISTSQASTQSGGLPHGGHSSSGSNHIPFPFQGQSPSALIMTNEPRLSDSEIQKTNRSKFSAAKAIQRAQTPDTDFLSLWLCATDALEATTGDNSKPIGALSQITQCFLLNLQTPTVHGTFALMLGPADELLRDSLIEMLMDDLFASMVARGFGAPAENEYDLVEVEEQIMREEILERARFRSAREGVVAEIEVAYMDHTDMMAYAEFNEENVKEVPLLSISTESALDFRVYLKMPTSRRYLRYVNENRQLSSNQAARLSSFGIRTVIVEAAQYKLYLVHAARAQVEEGLKKRGLRLVKVKK